MTPAQARSTLSNVFANVWGSTTPIAWTNTLPNTPGNAWVRFSVQHSGSQLQSWGGDTQNWLHYGLVCVQIFVRIGVGSQQADQLAQQAKAILMGKRLGEMATFESIISEDGPDGHGWDQTRVLVRFEYRE
jgi:hypothetical protein